LIGLTLSDFLSGQGMVVEGVTSADAAMELLSSGKFSPDIVIADLRLRGTTSGLWLMQWLKDNAPHVRVIGTSADGAQIHQLKELCAGGIFVKPYKLDAIGDRIRQIVQIPKD
jgi:DNA-binding response OmpR family regulator